MKKITVKFRSGCKKCGHTIEPGTEVLWQKAAGGEKAFVAHLEGTCPKEAAPKPGVENVGDFSGVLALFAKAKAHLKYPKIRFTVEGVPVKLWMAGENSRYHGAICIADDVAFGRGRFFGHIVAGGAFSKTRAAAELPKLGQVLVALNNDPAGFAAAYGKRTGNCCFCARDLTDARSVSVGYGPTCAGHYGLPWGAAAAEPFNPKPDADLPMVDEDGWDEEGLAEAECSECYYCGGNCAGDCQEAELAELQGAA